MHIFDSAVFPVSFDQGKTKTKPCTQIHFTVHMWLCEERKSDTKARKKNKYKVSRSQKISVEGTGSANKVINCNKFYLWKRAMIFTC